MSSRRVVVTGTAMVTALGHEVQESWSSFGTGEGDGSSAFAFNRIGLPASDISLTEAVIAGGTSARNVRRMAHFALLALYASQRLKESSGYDRHTAWPAASGVVIGSSVGGAEQIDQQSERLLQRGPDRVSAFFIPLIMTNAAAGQVAIENQLTGPGLGLSSGSLSAFASIAEAFAAIRRGACDQMICGAVETAGATLSANRLLSHWAARPSKTSATDHTMSVAGLLHLESLQSAQERSAPVLAELTAADVRLTNANTDDASFSRMESCRIAAGNRQVELDRLNGVAPVFTATLAPVLAAAAIAAGGVPNNSANMNDWFGNAALTGHPAEHAVVTANCSLGYRGRLSLQHSRADA